MKITLHYELKLLRLVLQRMFFNYQRS